MFKNLNQREQILILVLGLLAVGFLYYYFAYQPLQENISNVERQVNIRERELMRTKVLVRKLPQLEKKYNSMKGLKKKIELEDLNVESFFEMLDELTKEFNITLSSYTPSSGKERVNVNINIKGTYTNLIDFLYGLQIFQGQVVFEEIQVNGGQEEGLNVRMQLSYELNNGGDRS